MALTSLASLEMNAIKLYIHDNSFVLMKQGSLLEIFFDGTLKQKENYEPAPDLKAFVCYGIVGLLEGYLNKYLVVVSQVQQRGLLFTHPTYVIEKTTCICLNAEIARKTLSLDSYKPGIHFDTKTSTSDDTANIDFRGDESNNNTGKISSSSSSSTTTVSIQIPSMSLPVTTPATGHGVLTASSDSGPASSFLTSKSASPSILNIFKKPLNSGNDNSTITKSTYSSSDSLSSMSSSLPTPVIKSPSSSSSSPISNSTSAILDAKSAASRPISEETVVLEQRLLKEVTHFFSRQMFIFAHGVDLTNSMQRDFKKKKMPVDSDTPSKFKTVDRRFWWNEHLSQPFINAKLDGWILPIIQGTIQVVPCEIDGFPFTFVLISRRSRERAGLRYQRRGVNDSGEVANFVETEQIVIFEREGIHHVASFVQTRGSIPLFWSQSPYTLHPDPTLHRSDEENTEAFERHFEQQQALYGDQAVVNLTELSGREAILGSEYRHYIEKLGSPHIKYVEFDFHRETKGMRFENINKLSDSLYDNMTKMAYFWEADNDTVYCEQSGVFRTNCMDCLDRTNVVQSSFARKILNLQLMRFGISEYPDKGIKYYEKFERIFNNVWANNGDMISRMYTGTSALKGDFTRTGKRNFTGIMNDASNSLARMYFNTVKDFWGQATIDYILGYHKLDIFQRVPESSQRSAEPGIEKWLDKIRSTAIEVSSEIVIADDEVKLQGWTLLAPKETRNGKRSTKRFEEKVILLTSKALYVCSYNYHLEKVVQFKRVELCTIQSIQVGEYILSSLTPESRDPNQNYGFCIYYNSNGQIMRWNTGSLFNQSLDDLNIMSSETGNDKKEAAVNDIDMDNDGDVESDSSSASLSSSPSSTSAGDSDSATQRACLAFKAVRYNVACDRKVEQILTCKEQVHGVVDQIVKQCGKVNADKFVVHKPIINLAQAEKMDGLLKKVGYKIKHAIWI